MLGKSDITKPVIDNKSAAQLVPVLERGLGKNMATLVGGGCSNNCGLFLQTEAEFRGVFLHPAHQISDSTNPSGTGRLYHTKLYHTILYYTILYYTILYYTILYYTILYYTILYYTIPYSTILDHTVLYHTIPYHIILHYTILYYIYYTGMPRQEHCTTTGTWLNMLYHVLADTV